MTHPIFTPALTVALASLALAATPSAQLEEPPPGTVLVRGQRTKVGSKVNDVKALILQHEEMRNSFAAETPMHSVQVEDFYLMVTEVTNEQYLAFVQATGVQPPLTWGKEAIDSVGRKAFFEAQEEEKKKAQERGERFVRGNFDDARWWNENWQNHSWEVPKDRLNHPVTHVNYQDARAYAAWAGLRLMTEFEYQCAGRGKTENPYPWGEEWDNKKYAASIHDGKDYDYAVGSFPDGAIQGIHDLSGNLWEWTSSPFVPYKGYKTIKLEIGKGKQKRDVECMGAFDANFRVAVGGCYITDKLSLRLTTRRGTDRFQRTAALGFRCAASTKPGRDLAMHVLRENLSGEVIPEGVAYEPEGPTVLQRWQWTDGASIGGPVEQGDAEPNGGAAVASSRPAGYAVIDSYDAMLFVPSKEIDGVNVKGLKDASLEKGPHHFGVFHTTVPTMEPALEPGTYMLAWRSAGEVKAAKDDDEKEDEDAASDAGALFDFTKAPGFSPEVDQYVFFDATGAPVAAAASPPLLYDRMKPGRVVLETYVPPTPGELEQFEKDGVTPPTPADTVRFSVAVQGRQRNKGFYFVLPVKMKPGAVDGTWKSR